jgi:hypothetical protein
MLRDARRGKKKHILPRSRDRASDGRAGRIRPEAARLKANPAQAEAPERAEAVVQKAMLLAQENGLAPRIAETTYRAIVRSFIDYEQRIFAAAAVVTMQLFRGRR